MYAASRWIRKNCERKQQVRDVAAATDAARIQHPRSTGHDVRMALAACSESERAISLHMEKLETSAGPMIASSPADVKRTAFGQ